ncbi:hypothetical protein PQQ51_15190 [Paraburkholderia xenovorans]|uniref:hypothetical protein n=1 Tax=Paraburkholderia xenovorans TaxID=36873 RepID=UPI0038BC997A
MRSALWRFNGRADGKVDGEMKRNLSRKRRKGAVREEQAQKWLTLIEFADSVFDMLP